MDGYQRDVSGGRAIADTTADTFQEGQEHCADRGMFTMPRKKQRESLEIEVLTIMSSLDDAERCACAH